MTPLHVGIIGAGQAGERHAVGFDQTDAAEVVALADLVPERANALATAFWTKRARSCRSSLIRPLAAISKTKTLPKSLHQIWRRSALRSSPRPMIGRSSLKRRPNVALG